MTTLFNNQAGLIPHFLSYDWANALYPMWGYPAWLQAFGRYPQVVLGAVMLYVLYRVYQFKWWHIPLWYPYCVGVYVVWPDAIVLPLLLGVYAFQKSNPMLAALFLGLTANFRFEYIAFAPVLRKYGLVVLLCLLPWFARRYMVAGDIGGSTNGGHVAYVSLGQLPNNVWGIEHKDEFAFSQTNAERYSPEYDRIMWGKFRDAVASHPFEYLRKVGYNAILTMRGPYSPPFKAVYALIFIGLLFTAIYNCKKLSPFFWVKVGLMCLLQAESRHLTAVFPLLFLDEKT